MDNLMMKMKKKIIFSATVVESQSVHYRSSFLANLICHMDKSLLLQK